MTTEATHKSLSEEKAFLPHDSPKYDGSSANTSSQQNADNNENFTATATNTIDNPELPPTLSHTKEDESPQQPPPLLVRHLSMMSSSFRPSSTTAARGDGHSLLGITLIMLGSFSFSCMFLFVKLMAGKANSFTVAFYRAFVEVPIALYLCTGEVAGNSGLEKYLGPRNGHVRQWLLVRGGTGGAAVLCFFYAIQHLSLPDAVTLQFTTPPFAAAFAVCFVGEQWKRLDMMGAVVCFMGVVLIAHPTWLFVEQGTTTSTVNDGPDHNTAVSNVVEDDTNNLLAIAIALLGAAFAGMAYMSVRKIGHQASANIMVLYYSCLSLPVTLLGSKGFTGTWNVWAGGSNLSGWDWCWMLLTGLTAYAGQYLTNLGLQYETAATGTLATCTQIVFTYAFELAFLHEPINGWSVAGTLLIIGFMVMVGVSKMKKGADDDTSTIHCETVAGEPEELALMVSAEQHHTGEPSSDSDRYL